eukprot:s299_g20.t1
MGLTCVEGDSPLEVFATWGDTNEKVVAGSVEGLDKHVVEIRGSDLQCLYDPGEESDDSLQPPKGGYAYGGSSRPSAGGSSLDCLQLLKVPCELKGQMVICGEGEALGGWNPYMAPTLKHVGTSGDREVWALPGLLADLTPGMAFKFVCLGHNGIPRWEENRPNRFWTCEEGAGTWVGLTMHGLEERKSLGGPTKSSTSHPGDAGRLRPEIFHAFNWKFADVQRKANTIAALGFDAVQLSPAQRSVEGDQWWARYQPTKYEEIHGHVRRLDCWSLEIWSSTTCRLLLAAKNGGKRNRRATCDHDDGLMEILQRRLSQKLGPTFNRDDFQWPWYPLEGDDWDGEQRMEGWGCGEWSELKGGAPKVVSVHNAHVAKLMLGMATAWKSCGVSGFRFDAAKHMRPEHIANYVDKADVYAYGEVLSIDPSMQREYTEGVSLTTGEQFPTTDFLLGVWLRKFIEVGPHAVDFEHHEWVKHLRELEMKRPSELPERAGTVEDGRMSTPLLARNSIRFARNHDTVCNDVPFYGLTGWSQASAQVAAAWLLATHDGSVLLLADDVKKSRMIKEALAYRKALRSFIESLTVEQRQTIRTEVRVKEAEDGGRPLSICVAVRVDAGPTSWGRAGEPVIEPSRLEIRRWCSMATELSTSPCAWHPTKEPSSWPDFEAWRLRKNLDLRLMNLANAFEQHREKRWTELNCLDGIPMIFPYRITNHKRDHQQRFALHIFPAAPVALSLEHSAATGNGWGHARMTRASPAEPPPARQPPLGTRNGTTREATAAARRALTARLRRQRGPEALKELRELRSHLAGGGASVPTNVFHFNAVLAAGLPWATALALMMEMLLEQDLLSRTMRYEMGIQPDVVTYGSVISSCERGEAWQMALQTLALMQRDGEEMDSTCRRDVISFSALMAAEGGWRLALELLEWHGSWTSAVALLEAPWFGKGDGMRHDFGGAAAQRDHAQCGAKGLPRVISALEPFGLWTLALQILTKMPKQVSGGVGGNSWAMEQHGFVYSQFGDAALHGEAGEWEVALQLLMNMLQAGHKKWEIYVSVNSAISACAQSGSLEIAVTWAGPNLQISQLKVTRKLFLLQ